MHPLIMKAKASAEVAFALNVQRSNLSREEIGSLMLQNLDYTVAKHGNGFEQRQFRKAFGVKK